MIDLKIHLIFNMYCQWIMLKIPFNVVTTLTMKAITVTCVVHNLSEFVLS